MKNYDTLLFDADDTLLDFKRAEREALLLSTAAFGIDCSEAMLAEYSEINLSLWKLLERGGILKERLRVRRFELFCARFELSVSPAALAAEYTDRLSEQSFTVNGAIEVCGRLSEKYRMYVITNGLKSVQEKRFAKSGLKNFFLGEFISEDLGHEKPHAEFFAEVEKRIPSFSADRALVIGDSLTSDIAGGIGAGIDTCWYNPNGLAAPHDREISYTIGSLNELCDMLLPELPENDV